MLSKDKSNKQVKDTQAKIQLKDIIANEKQIKIYKETHPNQSNNSKDMQLNNSKDMVI